MTTATGELTPGSAEEQVRELQILVVDDNADCAGSMCDLLQKFGYEVRAARDGPTALELARAAKPDVILLDIGMPGMDGYEVAKRLKSRAGAKPPLLVAVTGFGREEDRRRAAESGFDLHLVKPADPSYLHRLLQEYARSHLRP